jgi:hypothetical protein
MIFGESVDWLVSLSIFSRADRWSHGSYEVYPAFGLYVPNKHSLGHWGKVKISKNIRAASAVIGLFVFLRR